MKKNIFIFILTMLFFTGYAREFTGMRFDFSSASILKRQWVHKGKQFGTPHTKFYVVNSSKALDGKALAVSAKRSSGVLITRITDDIWEKYPVMRWRWRILRSVRFTGKEPDDQAAVIYFGDGSMLKQFMVAYRWEHDFLKGSKSILRYGMGSTLVKRICMQNKKAVPGQWYEEERNVVEDFRRAFKRMPEGDCALSVGANSQYSKSDTLVEIDFIEFRSKRKHLPVETKTAERKIKR